MVCISCIVIPLFLWVWHRFLQPYVVPYLPLKLQNYLKSKPNPAKDGSNTKDQTKANGTSSCGQTVENVSNGQTTVTQAEKKSE